MTGTRSMAQQTRGVNAAMGASGTGYRPVTQGQVSNQWARGINAAMGASGTGYTPVSASQVSRAYGGYGSTGSPGASQPENSSKGRNAGLAGVSGFGFGAPIVASFAERAALKTEAYYIDYAAKAAELEGQRQAIVAMDDFARAQARSNAAIGASGIGYEGSPIRALEQNDARMGRMLELIKANTGVQVAGYKAQAKQIRKQAKMAPGIATLGAVQNLAGMVMSYYTGGVMNNSSLSGSPTTGTR